MNQTLEALEAFLSALALRIQSVRREIHAHPELAFGEWHTAERVAAHLETLGLKVRRGLAGTGVVGTLSWGKGGPAIGLRADMDALPIEEMNTFAHRSTKQGLMHACGHDGHVAMLLGAADALVSLHDILPLNGTVHFIFQPAEEHEGGAKAMLAQGLLDQCPMDAVFGLHNWPGLPVGEMAVTAGPVMAGADRIEILIRGQGGHAAMPNQTKDVVLAGAALVQALQSVISRGRDPLEPAVLSVTRFHAGQADNVLPEEAVLGGTVRAFSEMEQQRIETGIRQVCEGVALAQGVSIHLNYERGYPPTINTAAEAACCAEVAARILGTDKVHRDVRPSMGAEDFAYFLQQRPGCYVWLGNGIEGSGQGGCMLHSPTYDFNDALIPYGIRYWVGLVERLLSV